MRIDADNDDVLYITCPRCGVSWYGKIKYYEINEKGDITSFVIQGWDDVDVIKQIKCLNCGLDYVAVSGEGGFHSLVAIKMWDFVAKALTTVRG